MPTPVAFGEENLILKDGPSLLSYNFPGAQYSVFCLARVNRKQWTYFPWYNAWFWELGCLQINSWLELPIKSCCVTIPSAPPYLPKHVLNKKTISESGGEIDRLHMEDNVNISTKLDHDWMILVLSNNLQGNFPSSNFIKLNNELQIQTSHHGSDRWTGHHSKEDERS